MKRNEKWNTLDDILNSIWTMLKRGVTDFTDPFHWPVLGTAGSSGCKMRTMILRQVVVSERMLVCHTDARSPKVEAIRSNPAISWLLYHPEKRVQLRLSGQATLHADDRFADEQWRNTRITSRINYCAVEPPGTPVGKPSSGLPDFLKNKVPTLLESERGRKYFMAIACRIDSIDWLKLQLTGNRRARFDWDESGVHARWLVP